MSNAQLSQGIRMKITIVAGARPNFMKVAPIIRSIQAQQDAGVDIEYRLVHTGQHYDKKMSGDFFEQLNLPEPDANLGAGGGTQAEQTSAIMIGFEKELLENRPDLVIVVGDVTSTMSCSISAKKLHVDVAHVEGGIRSGDLSMPEEINRMVTDSITDLFFTTTHSAGDQLLKEGHSSEKIHFVGNTMIDTLHDRMSHLKKPSIVDEHGLKNGEFLVLTLHRPSNVDAENDLLNLLEKILESSEDRPIVFPVHPRTAKVLGKAGFQNDRLITTDPLGYLEFVYLLKNCQGVITDSGGITEEATVLGIPCITLRTSTERPETVTIGTNELIGTNPEDVGPWITKMLSGNWKKGGIPELWDGKTADRIVQVLLERYE
jgi:UDP-N-acetylglucosamine 2-epimerase (non-hydrolysing)